MPDWRHLTDASGRYFDGEQATEKMRAVDDRGGTPARLWKTKTGVWTLEEKHPDTGNRLLLELDQDAAYGWMLEHGHAADVPTADRTRLEI